MKTIFSMRMAVLMLFLFAIIAGGATFIENDYGTQTAQALVYKARWFEVFLGYFVAIVVYQLIKNKTWKSKPAVFLFHFSFLVIVIGAAITRYIGYEGVMPIREGATSNTMVSATKVLQIHAKYGEKERHAEKELYFSSMTSNFLNQSFSIGDKEVNVELLKYLPTYHHEVTASDKGKKLLELKVSTGQQGKVHFLAKGEKINFGSFYIGYETQATKDKPMLLITDEASGYKMYFPFALKTLNMNDKVSGELAPGGNVFKNRMLYQFGSNAVVLKDVHEKAVLKLLSNDIKTQRGQAEYMQWKVSVGDKSKIIETMPFSGRKGEIKHLDLDGIQIDFRVGVKDIKLPFSIQLKDFQLERYPGSMTPASYASEVVLIDKEQDINMPYRIYMNHILDHRNYRFFQSSYDPDEKGTVLSVNHDPGTWPTYIGYILMTLGMLWSLFAPNGRFQKLLKGARKLQSTSLALAFALLLALNPQSMQAASPKVSDEVLKTMQSYDLQHTLNFGKIAVQDHQGRMKPMDTVAHEVISKVTGRSALYDLEPTQMLLGMIMQPALYQDVPMIKIGHKKIAVMLGLPESTKYAAFSSFFAKKDSSYKIFDEVTKASQKKPLEKAQYDKELIKIDERVNVAFMAYQGSILRIYPKPNDANNKWMAPMDAIKEYAKEHSDA
ncbi:MAG TPA: cytochrome C biogenesis protein, partial [Sulfurovum sp.]|nr:cytochrome C biogenesis protein [Sulfurovum sp.]